MHLIAQHTKLAPLRLPVIQENNALLHHHFSWCKKPYTMSDNVSYLERVMKEHEQKLGFHFALIHANHYVGEIAIDAFYEEHTIGNVCYWIAQKHQGKGYAKTALLHLTQWAKKHTQLAYLQIRMEEENTASRAVAQSAGAVYVKTILDFNTSTGRIATVYEYHLIIGQKSEMI
ncbi:MAG: GNAT family N-acetyltransferase [Aureispira sp.]